MSKRTPAKHKIDRRMGENIWGRPKSPVNRREYGPGEHGQRRRGKLSDFGVQLMAKQQVKDAFAPAPVGQKRIARLARGGLNPGSRFGSAPDQGMRGDTAGGQPAPDLPGFTGGVRAQPVVDGECGDAAAPRARPAIGEQTQRHAVGAARDRNCKPRRPLERAERCDQRGEPGVVERADWPGRAQTHSAWSRSRARACWMCAGAFGNSFASSS